MKILQFIDAAGTDENFFPAANCTQVQVTNNTSVLLYFKNSGDITDHVIDITVTAGKADEVALKMAEHIAGGGIGYNGVFKFIAGTAPLEDASSIAYAIGADA